MHSSNGYNKLMLKRDSSYQLRHADGERSMSGRSETKKDVSCTVTHLLNSLREIRPVVDSKPSIRITNGWPVASGESSITTKLPREDKGSAIHNARPLLFADPAIASAAPRIRPRATQNTPGRSRKVCGVYKTPLLQVLFGGRGYNEDIEYTEPHASSSILHNVKRSESDYQEPRKHRHGAEKEPAGLLLLRQAAELEAENERRIVDVWSENLEAEFSRIKRIVEKYQYVAMVSCPSCYSDDFAVNGFCVQDTEFPGVVAKPTGCHSENDYNYKTVKFNVDLLKVIQLGITFADERGMLPRGTCTWQFNFKFDLNKDMYAKNSIDFLRESGIDFETHQEHGIGIQEFGELMISSGLVMNKNVKWVSFHGSYDFGYLFKLLTGCAPLPETQRDFFAQLKDYFPSLYDIKYILSAVPHLDYKLSLQGISEILNVQRIGRQHQAGSDSLVTCHTFFRLMDLYFDNRLDDALFSGYIFGLGGPALLPIGAPLGLPPGPPPSAPLPDPLDESDRLSGSDDNKVVEDGPLASSHKRNKWKPPHFSGERPVQDRYAQTAETLKELNKQQQDNMRFMPSTETDDLDDVPPPDEDDEEDEDEMSAVVPPPAQKSTTTSGSMPSLRALLDARRADLGPHLGAQGRIPNGGFLNSQRPHNSRYPTDDSIRNNEKRNGRYRETVLFRDSGSNSKVNTLATTTGNAASVDSMSSNFSKQSLAESKNAGNNNASSRSYLLNGDVGTTGDQRSVNLMNFAAHGQILVVPRPPASETAGSSESIGAAGPSNFGEVLDGEFASTRNSNNANQYSIYPRKPGSAQITKLRPRISTFHQQQRRDPLHSTSAADLLEVSIPPYSRGGKRDETGDIGHYAKAGSNDNGSTFSGRNVQSNSFPQQGKNRLSVGQQRWQNNPRPRRFDRSSNGSSQNSYNNFHSQSNNGANWPSPTNRSPAFRNPHSNRRTFTKYTPTNIPERPVSGLIPEKPVSGLIPEKPVSGLIPEKPVSGLIPEKPGSGPMSVLKPKR